MGYEQLITLPERSIGRAGRDLFLSHKDVTIIMVPYERYSIFPKAVDELYRTIQIPFNLIVVEGNAPEGIRIQLEKRQRRHANMTIIYTNHCPSLANAFNLAVPHFKTPYALFMDNEMRLPEGTLEKMLEAAQENHAAVISPQDSMLERQLHTPKASGSEVLSRVTTFGIKPCFLLSQDALAGMGKLFDDASSPYTLGVDVHYKLRSKGLKVCEYVGAKIETRPESALQPGDFPLFRTQWNRERLLQSYDQLEKKWGVKLAEDPIYGTWLHEKIQIAEKPVGGLEMLWNGLASNLRENGWKKVRDTVFYLRSLHWQKSSYVSKVNAR
jgi:glycosyltransferase involved in cell wall biosynthesis